MAEAVWGSLARRGVLRADQATWPSGFVPKNQDLRKSKVFDAFGSAATAEVLDELLGAGAWRYAGAWGPALVTFPQPGPWTVPHTIWHFDLPARGDPVRIDALRLFGYAA